MLSKKEAKLLNLLHFTVEQIKEICCNPITLSIVCDILAEKPGKLRKLCKYINVLIENYEKSPETIIKSIKKSKIKDKTKLKDLPHDILENILDKYKEILPKN